MTELPLNQIKIEEEDKPLKYRQVDDEVMDDSVNLGNLGHLDDSDHVSGAGYTDDSGNSDNPNDNHEKSSKSKKMFIIAIIVLIVVVVLLVMGWLGGSNESSSSDKQTVQSLSDAVSQRNNESRQGVLRGKTKQDISDAMIPNSSTLRNGSNVNDKDDFIDAAGNKYQKIAPTEVNADSTTTDKSSAVSPSKERIDIPGEIVDLMVNGYNQDATLSDVKSTSQRVSTNPLIPLTQFTIQIVASSNEASVQDLAKKLNLSHYWIYETRLKETPWFVLIQGSYSSSAQAKDVLDKLSPEIKQYKPWIKSGLRVEQERAQRNN